MTRNANYLRAEQYPNAPGVQGSPGIVSSCFAKPNRDIESMTIKPEGVTDGVSNHIARS